MSAEIVFVALSRIELHLHAPNAHFSRAAVPRLDIPGSQFDSMAQGDGIRISFIATAE